jgi:hypothetical protein
MTAKQIALNTPIASKDTAMETSAVSKKAHLNPEIRYTAGLNRVTVCQTGGNISIE